MHLLMAVGMILWFVLVGLLWYARLGDVLWLVGSVALGVVYFSGSFWYLTRTE